MKKIIVLAIALLSTGIVVGTTYKREVNAKPVVKIEKTAPAQGNVANDSVASAD
jgi:hypothetical protein